MFTRPNEKMADIAFKAMTFTFKIVDCIFPHVEKRIRKFNIKKGMTVIDYGCGPGRYSVIFSKIVGNEGLVYSVDIHELAIASVVKKIKKKNITNIKASLSTGNDDGKYNTKLPDNIADVVCAIDMFFVIKNPKEFMNEIKRVLKNEGTLILDDGHQSRKETKTKIQDAGVFEIFEETKDHLKCRIKTV